MRDIITTGDSGQEQLLRNRSKSIDLPTINYEELDILISVMRRAVQQSGGCGLAAVQLGFLESVILIGGRPSDVQERVMINTEVIKKKGPYTTQEGCLSIPDHLFTVTRYTDIEVNYYDIYQDRQVYQQVFTGREAQIIQHEVDHLNGILIDSQQEDKA